MCELKEKYESHINHLEIESGARVDKQKLYKEVQSLTLEKSELIKNLSKLEKERDRYLEELTSQKLVIKSLSEPEAKVSIDSPNVLKCSNLSIIPSKITLTLISLNKQVLRCQNQLRNQIEANK